MNIKINFPDNKEKEFKSGITIAEAVSTWNKTALVNAVAAKINGVSIDLSHALKENSEVGLIDISSKDGLAVLRHSISHVMAQAVQDVFKGA